MLMLKVLPFKLVVPHKQPRFPSHSPTENVAQPFILEQFPMSNLCFLQTLGSLGQRCTLWCKSASFPQRIESVVKIQMRILRPVTVVGGQ